MHSYSTQTKVIKVKKVESAYSLLHGGIAIHLKDEKYRQDIMDNWATEKLCGNSVIHTPRLSKLRSTETYLHNIQTKLEESYIHKELSTDCNVCRVHRLKSETQANTYQ